jgi:hypothetical protein
VIPIQPPVSGREPSPLGHLSRYQFPGLYRFEQSSPAILASFGSDSYTTSTILCSTRALVLARAFHKEGCCHYEVSFMPESEHPSLPVPRNSRVSSSEGLFRSPIPLLDV